MPRQPRTISTTGMYHIIQRGINRDALFCDAQDFRKYLNLVIKYRDEGKYEILAYCLMVNHVHLLMDYCGDPPGLFVKKLSVSYSGFFNKKYKRIGHLFQDRFKSLPVEDERYLLALVKYIHNNPEKAGICPASQYQWSSYSEYLYGEQVVNTRFLLDILGGRDAYIQSLSEVDPYFESEFENVRKSDAEARTIIEFLTESNDFHALKAMDKRSRDRLLEDIIKRGVSGVQLSRITGISYSTIKRRQRKN